MNLAVYSGNVGPPTVIVQSDPDDFSQARASDSGLYRCVFRSACGESSAAAATVTVLPPCASDFNIDGVVDFFDYLDFVQAFSSQLPAADYNADSIVDFFDYLDFVQAFSTGC